MNIDSKCNNPRSPSQGSVFRHDCKEDALYCAVDPTDALAASKAAFKSISRHLPANAPKEVWRQMIFAVQMVCEALEHKPMSLNEYNQCQAEADLFLQRLAKPEHQARGGS